MEKTQIDECETVEARGDVHEVYKTQTGLETANVDSDNEGWLQYLSNKRMKVVARTVGQNIRIRVWEAA